MSDKQTTSKSTNAESPPGDNAKKSKKKKRKEDGTRETIESIAIAFILAFLFKTFQAEAYVIPTGSMAPTLYGRHKEVTCDGCRYSFAVGASSEIDQDSGTLTWRLEDVFCPNCGKHNHAKEAAVFNGDRILVNKQVKEFRRFDVVVFKNPEQGHVNYIKRLVGLPDETIRIRKGDIWGRKKGEDSWKILRKDDPFVQKDIQLTVYDDDYPARTLIEAGWPERWESAVESTETGSVGGWLPAKNGWTADRDDRTYACQADSIQNHWLRYRHFLPNETTWPHPEQANPVLPRPEASLIADFCSFNAYDRPSWNQTAKPTGIYWTGDLTVSAHVEVQAVDSGAAFIVQLVEGPQTFSCAIDLNTGSVEVTESDSDNPELPNRVLCSGSTSMTGPGSYDVSLANVDDRICLWINDDLIDLGPSASYESSDVPDPGQRDLAPAGIALRGAAATVSSLLLERDIYYRNESVEFSPEDGVSVVQNSQREVSSERQLQMLLNDPDAWSKRYQEEVIVQLDAYGDYGDYTLDSDEYLMFGDNSSMSKDSRLFDYFSRPMNGIFSHRYAVRKRDLIGKALYIFWPHGIPFLNGGEGIAVRHHSGPEGTDPKTYPSMRLPFYPNISRMKKIR